MPLYTSIQQFINDGSCFYHVTHKKHRTSIIQKGLQRRIGSGIYVTRSASIMGARSIFEDYCVADLDPNVTDTRYEAIMIKIDPKKHEIKANEILADHAVNSRTLITHNIIKRASINIDEEDIIDLDSWPPISDINSAEIETENAKHPLNLYFSKNGVLVQYRFNDNSLGSGITQNSWSICDL